MPSPLGGARDCGQPLLIEASESDSRIPPLVLEGLRSFEQRSYDSRLERRSSDSERQAFVKEHLLVIVTKTSPNHLRVSACERNGLSYGGVKDGDVLLDFATAVEELPKAIHHAFSKAI